MLKLWEAGKEMDMYENSFVEEVLRTCIQEEIGWNGIPGI